MSELDPDCIVFNWECSSGYSTSEFTEGADKVMKLVSYLMRGGHMAMFSDFSLKAFIPNWDEKALGPNPFVKLPGEYSGNAQLKFEPVALKHSPSMQLQSVGALSAGGKCLVHCLRGTITYTINKSVNGNGFYELEVITIAGNVNASE